MERMSQYMRPPKSIIHMPWAVERSYTVAKNIKREDVNDQKIKRKEGSEAPITPFDWPARQMKTLSSCVKQANIPSWDISW